MTRSSQLMSGQHVHFIGIGGTGLSAIARVLLLRGFAVSGSDLRANPETAALAEMGAVVFHGHDPANINGADLVIRSSAVSDDHVEVRSAQSQNIPVVKRADTLGALMDGFTTIAVAGTHGKTTTTSMVTHALIEAGQDPSYIVGGALANTGTNAGVGQGHAFVIEADEYDNMFHGLRPQIAVVTSIEFDHPDFFHTPQQLLASFARFIDLLPDDGLLVCCADDAAAYDFALARQRSQLPVMTYGIDQPADWRAVNIRYENHKTLYDAILQDTPMGTIELDTPGRHNILNSLAALAVVHHEGVAFDAAASALASFRGASRRFDVRANVSGIIVVDDYAHHPTAIRKVLDAARQRYPDHALWAVWQPHTFSRTRSLYADYLRAFDDADHVIVTAIYASRERPQDFPDVHIQAFVDELDHPDKYFAPDFDRAVSVLRQNVTTPALILIMSAGDAPEIGIEYVKQLRAEDA